MIPLRQSTAATVVLGPYVDDIDGKTFENALTIVQADVRLSKNGAAFAQKNDATSATFRENGEYACPLNATDTNTLGHLRIDAPKTGALPVWVDCVVYPAAVFDTLFGTTGAIPANATQIGGSTEAATDLSEMAATKIKGTVTNAGLAPSATVFEASDITNATTDFYKGLTLKFITGALAGQATDVTGYSLVGGRGRFTVTALTGAPANGDQFILY